MKETVSSLISIFVSDSESKAAKVQRVNRLIDRDVLLAVDLPDSLIIIFLFILALHSALIATLLVFAHLAVLRALFALLVISSHLFVATLLSLLALSLAELFHGPGKAEIGAELLLTVGVQLNLDRVDEGLRSRQLGGILGVFQHVVGLVVGEPGEEAVDCRDDGEAEVDTVAPNNFCGGKVFNKCLANHGNESERPDGEATVEIDSVAHLPVVRLVVAELAVFIVSIKRAVLECFHTVVRHIAESNHKQGDPDPELGLLLLLSHLVFPVFVVALHVAFLAAGGTFRLAAGLAASIGSVATTRTLNRHHVFILINAQIGVSRRADLLLEHVV